MTTTVQGSIEYTVNTDLMTCTCPDFKFKRSYLSVDNPKRACKHLAKFIPAKKRFRRDFADSVLNKLSILNKYNHTVCGSYRRGLETVGDIDVLILTDDLSNVVNWVSLRYEVLWSGVEKISFIVDGIQVDFRRCDKESLVTMTMYFTGSKNENIRLRIKASKIGMKLNEYGLWFDGIKVNCDSEESVYKALGLKYIKPKNR